MILLNKLLCFLVKSMSHIQNALKMLIERISESSALEDKELLLKRALATNIFPQLELIQLKQEANISRHLNLVYLVERKIEDVEFKEQDVWVSNRPPLMVIAETLLMTQLGSKPSKI